MTALTRYCHNVPEQFRYPIVHLFHGFSNTPPIDDQTIRKSEKENLEKIIKKSDIKVCIIGGGITPLYTAVLLKQYQIIKSIHLVDTKDSMLDFVTDMYNIKTQPHINYFKKNNIKQALDRVRLAPLSLFPEINKLINCYKTDIFMIDTPRCSIFMYILYVCRLKI